MMRKMESSRNADLIAIEEQTSDTYKYDFAFRMYPEQLECVRNGDPDLLIKTYSEQMYEYYEEALPDPALFHDVFVFLNGCLMMLAHEGGVPLNRCAAISTKYMKSVQDLSSVRQFVDSLKEMQIAYAKEAAYFRRSASGNQTVDAVQRYIYDHVNEKISVKQLSEFSGYSISRLQHLFQKYKGISITDQIRKEKITRACWLLKNTEYSCAAIAQKLSYCSQSYFIQQFEKETGMTPASWRLNHKE